MSSMTAIDQRLIILRDRVQKNLLKYVTENPNSKTFAQYLNRLALDYPREAFNIKMFKENMERHANSSTFQQISIEMFSNSTDENFLNKLLMFVDPASGNESRLLEMEHRLYEQSYRIECLEKQASQFAALIGLQEEGFSSQRQDEVPSLIPISSLDNYENEVISMDQYDVLDDDYIPYDDVMD
jgi:hypothetical protein